MDLKTSQSFNSSKGVIDCPSHLLKLNLGSGFLPFEGFKSVDISNETNPDYICDLFSYPWPFKTNSVFMLRASHFLEHVPDLIPFMNEAYRVLCDRGIFQIAIPYLTSKSAWQDPTHKQFLSEDAFPYYDREWRKQARLLHYPIHTHFQMRSCIYLFNPEYECLSNDAKNWARQHEWNVVRELVIVLEANKHDL